MILLLAQVQEQQQVFGSIRKGFSGSTYDAVDIGIIVLLSAAVLGIIGLFLLRRRQEKQDELNDPDQLFDELASGHGLIASQRELLLQLASAKSIKKPAMLFVRADLFDQAAKESTFKTDRARHQIESLRHVLFGE
jgi:hypothetical protein